MSKLVGPVVKLSKQKVVKGTVLDVLGSRCSVRLSTRGVVLHGLSFSGPTPKRNDTVLVDYRSGVPVVHANAENIDAKLDELRTELTSTIEDVATTPLPPPEEVSPSSSVRVTEIGNAVDIPSVAEMRFPENSLIDVGDGIVQINLGMGGGGGDIRIPIDGHLAAMTNAYVPILITTSMTIGKIYMLLEDKGASGSTIVDVNVGGSSLFTSSPKPEMAFDETEEVLSFTPDILELSEGDVLTIDIDQIAPGAQGLSLVVAAAVTVESAGIGRRMFTFTYDDELAINSGRLRMYNKFGEDLNFTRVYMSCHQAPTGTDIIVDIHREGVTLFTNQANRPRILDDETEGQTAVFDDSAFPEDSYITVDIDQVGSIVRGSFLTIHVIFE